MISIIGYDKIISTLDNKKWNKVYNELNDVNKRYSVFDNKTLNAIIKSTTTVLINEWRKKYTKSKYYKNQINGVPLFKYNFTKY